MICRPCRDRADHQQGMEPMADGDRTASAALLVRPTSSWTKPMAGVLTSPYGPRLGEFHLGVDVVAPFGTPIYAAQSGTVVDVGPANGFGNWVKLAHRGGLSTVYGHVSRWTVSLGQQVRAGQLIAACGNTGRSARPHLHFELHARGVPVDPVGFYIQSGGSNWGVARP